MFYVELQCPSFRPKLLPESPRWLISRGRNIEAMKILAKAAKVNGVKLDENINGVKAREEQDEGMKVILKKLFTSKTLLIRLLIVTGNW